ncbi:MULTISPECIES: 50S ribosomal protein L20 [Halobacteriovorax]|uniref:Large ribosomal subunit protein bL20 n=1 Tax=Halobacteriovorax vibrionivorans TaxID=2152716 RepID=A0ABY0IH05_9BACT|nr:MULTISPECIES: 50S ribosomal protein L20 [Halobacteriovorax]AYF44729.1 50S ribosomal protein L20 [Halobacteriovorax sp. BALOs_7]RZF20814.1 50S ribosomal protein L20 [Halobacteriovorax vibrionivorans]TGD48198.1 50S ribosomal protein L20 [Halobacteriovorax sp. Y22]
MSRVRRGFKARARRNKVLKLAKGFHFSRRTKYYHASETVKRALHYRYIGRRLLKRDMRKLWIVRISAAAKLLGTSYSKFMGQLKKNNVEINRKMLAEIAARDFEGFKAIYESTK